MRIPFFGNADEVKGPASAIFDVGSGSVAAAVILASADAPTRILFDTRITLSNEDRSEEQLAQALAKAAGEAGGLVLDQYARSPFAKAHGPVKDAYTSVHAPWVHSETLDSHVTLSTPAKIDKEMISKASQEGAAAKTELPKGHVPLEKTIVRVELNGYPTALPIGKSASSIRTLSMYSSISKSFQDGLLNAITSVLPGRTPILHSSMYAYSTVVRELANHASSYTFLDIASEASACSVIKSGAIAEQSAIPAGTRMLIRAAKTAAGQSAEGIYSMIRMITEGTCSDAACEEIEKVLSEAEPIFMRSFGEVFSTLSAESRLPNALIIAVHPALALWAESFFERIDFSQFTLTGKPFAVQLLETSLLTDLALFGKDASADTGLAVLGALVHIRYS